jgi:hypothetical protein
MQVCWNCGMYLIVNISAEIVNVIGDDPKVHCLNCHEMNEPKDDLEVDYSDGQDVGSTFTDGDDDYETVTGEPL